MRVHIREDSVEIEGYVNAIERESKPIQSRMGKFKERIRKGAFSRALERNKDVHVLLNHNWSRDLGSTEKGNLELHEDAIGLHARAVINDAEVIDKARKGDLVGWSFGFKDVDVEQGMENGMPTRSVKDLDLYEVSILDRSRTPAYEGTLLTARAEEDVQYQGEELLDEIQFTEEIREDKSCSEPEKVEENKKIDYSRYEAMVEEMKGACTCPKN